MHNPAGPEAALEPGRRELNKREKLARIRGAAREVFTRKGFEAATVREIASVADVAFGTLFLYVKHKQDLLLLLFDEELPALTQRAFRKAKPQMRFVDQIVAFFTEFYSFFSATPQLSRDMMREITFSSGIVAQRIWAGVQGTEHCLAGLVARAQASGAVASSLAPDLVAHIVFNLYRAEIRSYLRETELDMPASLGRLRQEIEILSTGLTPRKAGASFGLPGNGRVRK